MSVQYSPTGPDSRVGVGLIIGSAVAYSTAGFFTRLIDVDLWTLICWRGLFSTLFLLAVARIQNGPCALRAFRELDVWGWIAAGFSTAAMFCYLAALRHTSVADVAIIYGTAPFVTAVVALIVLRERTTQMTLGCSAIALAGIALTFAGSNLSEHALNGDLFAIAMTLLMAGMIIATRRSASASSLPIAAISSVASSILAAPLAQPGAPHAVQFAELALFGSTQLGLGLLLLTAGAKRMSASRVALIGGLDVPLAPIWVWIAFAQTPSLTTIVGGLVVIAAVTLNTLRPRRRQPARITETIDNEVATPPR